MSEESTSLSLRRTATEAEMDEMIGAINEISAPLDTSRPRIHDGENKGGKKLAFLSDIPTDEKPEFRWSVRLPTLDGIQGAIENEGSNQVGLITGTPAANFGSLIATGFDATLPENTFFTLSFEVTPSIVVMLQLVEGDFSDVSLSGEGPSNFFMMSQGGTVVFTSSHADISPTNLTSAVTTGIQEFGFERVANEWFLHFHGVRQRIHIAGDRDPIAAIIVGSMDGSAQTVRSNASADVPESANDLVVNLSSSNDVKASTVIKPVVSVKTNTEHLKYEKDKDGNISLTYSPYSTSINATTPSTVNYAITKDSIVAGKDPLIMMSSTFPNLEDGMIRTITIPTESTVKEIESIGAIYGLSNRGQKDGVQFQGAPGVQIIYNASIKDRGLLVALKTAPNKWFIHKIQNTREINNPLPNQISPDSNWNVLFSGQDVANISRIARAEVTQTFQIVEGSVYALPEDYTVIPSADGYRILNFYKGTSNRRRKLLSINPSFYGDNQSKKFYLSTSRDEDTLRIRCVDDSGARLDGVFDIQVRIVEI